MNIAIVDDQKEFLDIIRDIVSDMDYHFYSYTSVVDMEKTEIDFHLILLDIDMPDYNGIEYAKKHNDMNIIFITNRDDLVKRAFGNNVYGFISKSDPKEEYIQVIEEVSQQIKNQKIVNFKCGYDSYDFIEEKIIYFMYIGYKTVCLVYRQKNFIIKGYSLKEIREKLSEQFILIDKSTIINAKKIIYYIKGEIYLEGIEQSFPVSRSKKELIRKYLNERTNKSR